MMDTIGLIGALDNKNVQAFLRVVRVGETCQEDEAYRWLFGSTKANPKLFDTFADHPRIRTYEKYDGQFIKNGKIDYTTAAGAYQIVESTWDPIARQCGLKDFTPRNQDIAAVALIQGRGALQDVIEGRFEQAVAKCRKEWASLPGSTYGQPTVALERAKVEYVKWGGVFTTTQEKVMGPFVIPAITAIANAVPELAKVFGPNASETAQRNMKAAEVVVNVAKEALGAKNEQDVVEKLETEPDAPRILREAVKENWFMIQEVGGGIAAAREASMYATDKQGRKALPVHKQPAFWVTILLLVPVYWVVFMTLQPWFGDKELFSMEIKLVVVTAIISGVLSAVTGFWLGSSFGSQKKDDAQTAAMR